MDADWLLIHKIRNGDEAAIETFIQKHYSAILRYCYYRTSDSTTAEDLTQETFYRFFKSFSAYTHKGKLSNFLYTIAGNLCRDYWRSEQRVQREELTESIAFPTADIDSKMALQSAIDNLPEEFREIICLHFFMGMKLQEIAEAEGIGLSLVKYRLRRAKELLKKELGEEDQL